MNAITKTAWSNNKKNKTKSLLIMAAIFLSTMLLTVLAVFAYGLIKQQKANAVFNYGSYHGSFQSVDTGQLAEVKRRSEFESIGLTAGAGVIGGRAEAGLAVMDETARELSGTASQLASGRFPETEDEIAAQSAFFASAGYKDIQIGDTVSLDYRPDLEHPYKSRQFTVSGILKAPEQDSDQNSYTVYASGAFYEAEYAQKMRRYTVLFRLAEDVSVTSDNVEEVIGEIAQKCGIDKKRALVNTMYVLTALDPGYETIAVCTAVALIVIIISVIVIYNIFQVDIAQNIQEYGKILALGAVKKQMRRLIYWEGMSLAAISIPPGAIFGYAVSWAGFRVLMHISEGASAAGQVQVSIFSLPVLLAAAALAFLTVIFALRRPMKIVSSLSPVDALRFQEDTKSAKGVRKGRKKLSVFAMAAANIASQRRRTVRTILTMGISCVLFVVIASLAGNMDEEYEARKMAERGQFQIELDYSMNDKAYPENNLEAIIKNNPISGRFIEQVRALDGVTDVQTRDILFVKVNGQPDDAIVYEEADFNREKEAGGAVGEFDYQKDAGGDYFYYGWSYFLEDNDLTIGQPLTMEFSNGTEEKTAEGVLKASFGSTQAGWAVTQAMCEKLGLSGKSPGWLWVDCAPADTAAVRRQLEGLLSGMEHVKMTAYEDALALGKTSVWTMKAACYLLLGIIGLIGFMNLANTIIMNIITKKREYGILQAVGMTNRQLNFSLQIQGLIFSAGTVLVSLAAGLPLGYVLFVYAKDHAVFGLNVYHVPVPEAAGMAAVIVLLQLGLSFLLSRNLKKQSLVDRIRFEE